MCRYFPVFHLKDNPFLSVIYWCFLCSIPGTLLTILIDVEFMFIHFMNFSAILQLSVLWQEYLSEMFCSFIYLRSSFYPLVLFSFFAVSPFLFSSWQLSKSSASQFQHAPGVFKKFDRVKTDRWADSSLGSSPLLLLCTPVNINFSLRFCF